MIPYSEPLSGEPIILVTPPERNIIIWDISTAVSIITGIDIGGLRSKSRKRNLVIARQLFFYFGHNVFSLTALGKHLRRHHATVIYGYKTIEILLDQKGQEEVKRYVIETSKIISKYKK